MKTFIICFVVFMIMVIAAMYDSCPDYHEIDEIDCDIDPNETDKD